jgi:hypothetical protein
MSEAVREAREEAAERELAGRSKHGTRAFDEASAVLAGLERALTAEVRQPEPTAELQVESPGLDGAPLAVREERHMVPVPAPQMTLTRRALR